MTNDMPRDTSEPRRRDITASTVETMRLKVEQRMRLGERFTDVEDVIEACALPAEEKSALWLLAWSYVHPRAQRREANAHLEAKIATDTDAFVRDRHKAAVEHLKQTKEHRHALSVERDRTSALLDYALAFLEEARAGLAVARIQPGHDIPERLHDVLGRLRSYAHERHAERTIAAELGIL